GEMQRELQSILPAVGTPVGHRTADLRYLGQEHTVTIAIEDLGDWAELRQKFDAAHQRAYGYAAPDVEVQLLNLRLTVVFPLNPAAERMRITMIKTAYNHIISESLDFGCAIFDPDVQMIAQGVGLPLFQGHLGFPIQATIADRGIDAFREGDVFIHNDPYTG